MRHDARRRRRGRGLLQKAQCRRIRDDCIAGQAGLNQGIAEGQRAGKSRSRSKDIQLLVADRRPRRIDCGTGFIGKKRARATELFGQPFVVLIAIGQPVIWISRRRQMKKIPRRSGLWPFDQTPSADGQAGNEPFQLVTGRIV